MKQLIKPVNQELETSPQGCSKFTCYGYMNNICGVKTCPANCVAFSACIVGKPGFEQSKQSLME